MNQKYWPLDQSPAPPPTHNLLWVRVIYGGVLDLTLNKFRMELQGLCGGGGRSSMASENEDEAGFMDLFIYSTVSMVK